MIYCLQKKGTRFKFKEFLSAIVMKLKNNLIFASKCDILILECMDVVVIVTVLVLYAVGYRYANRVFY